MKVIQPSFRAFAEFLQLEYLPNTRLALKGLSRQLSRWQQRFFCDHNSDIGQARDCSLKHWKRLLWGVPRFPHNHKQGALHLELFIHLFNKVCSTWNSLSTFQRCWFSDRGRDSQHWPQWGWQDWGGDAPYCQRNGVSCSIFWIWYWWILELSSHTLYTNTQKIQNLS